MDVITDDTLPALPDGHRPRGIMFTVLQPSDASIDDRFTNLVDEALMEVAKMGSDQLPSDGSTWTARNGVRLRLRLINR